MDMVKVVAILALVGCFAMQAGISYVAVMSIRKITNRIMETMEDAKEIK